MQAPRSRTLADLAFEQAERYGDAPAVICGDRSVGYRELAERARRVAGGLRRLGIRRGERLGLLVNNRLEWVETFFGAAMLGSVVTAFSTWSKRDELDFLIGDSGVDALILLDRFGAQAFADDVADLVPEAGGGPPWRARRYPKLRELIALGDAAPGGWRRYEELHAAPPLEPLPPGDGPSAADDAIVIYTSGSSSRPKAVPLAQYGIVENGFNIGERMGLTPQDRVLVAPPLFWSYGSANALAATLTHGATLVLQGRFEAGEALALIERHRCTAIYTLPAMTSALVGHPEFRRERVRSLRTGLTIGSPQDVVAAATELGAAEICNVYGQTESYGNCCVTPHDWPLEGRARCQGPPLPGVSLRIVDAADGRILPPGETGLIEVRGYIMRGYVGASAAQNAAALAPDGYFRTGDVGMLTASGELVFAGRTTEMIKKGGINIAPAEVEELLLRHPEVAEAGVIGVPDVVQGEVIAAFVVAKPSSAVTAEALRSHCRGAASAYKTPDLIEFCPALPVTDTGKLLRRELKRMAEALAREAAAPPKRSKNDG